VLVAENQPTSLVKSKICYVISIRKTFEFTAKICLIRYIRVAIHMNHYSHPLIIGKIEFLSCTKLYCIKFILISFAEKSYWAPFFLLYRLWICLCSHTIVSCGDYKYKCNLLYPNCLFKSIC